MAGKEKAKKMNHRFTLFNKIRVQILASGVALIRVSYVGLFESW